jgi:replicative DNA helicase
LRAIVGEAHHMAEAAFDDFADPEALAAESISRLGRAATSDQNAQDTAHIADFLAVLDEPAKPRVPSGLALLDDLTGGFPRGAVTIVAGKTSRGKTAFACSCAFNIAEQFETGSLIVSAEMPRREIVMRLACLASGQSYTRWDRQMLNENQNRILRDWAAKLARDKRLAVLDCSKPTIGRIAVEIAKAVEKLGTRIVFVDYLQLCRPNPGEQFDRRDLAVHFVSTELLSIAKRHDIPVVALSQVNEDGELRESRGIEHDANTVIYLEAPDMERELGSREFITERAIQAVVRKNRGGRVGTVNLTMLTGPMRFISDQVPEAQRVAEAAAEEAAQTRMGW